MRFLLKKPHDKYNNTDSIYQTIFMNTLQSQHDKSVIKIGKTWFKPQFHSVLKLHEHLKEHIESDDFFRQQRDGHVYSNGCWKKIPLEMQKILEFIVETSVERCQQIRPEKLVHIKFSSLKRLSFIDLRLYNIEALQFLDLSQLESLVFTGDFGVCSQGNSDRLRNIRSLTKCRMPKIRTLDFQCGSIKSMGRDISRIKTSSFLGYVGLETNLGSDYWVDELRDQDMGIWAKMEANDISTLSRLYISDFGIQRISQKSVQECLRRKYKSVELENYSDSQDSEQ